MSVFVVSTQSLENYGAHTESGKFSDGASYWKFKGGSEIIVEGLDREQDAFAFAAAVLPNTVSFKEVPISVTEYDVWLENLREEWNDFDEAYEFFYKTAHKKVINPNKPETYKNLMF